MAKSYGTGKSPEVPVFQVGDAVVITTASNNEPAPEVGDVGIVAALDTAEVPLGAPIIYLLAVPGQEERLGCTGGYQESVEAEQVRLTFRPRYTPARVCAILREMFLEGANREAYTLFEQAVDALRARHEQTVKRTQRQQWDAGMRWLQSQIAGLGLAPGDWPDPAPDSEPDREDEDEN
jgi:hypothetical protein